MPDLQVSFADVFLLAILPVAAILLGVALAMLRNRRVALDRAIADLERERDRVRNALEGSSLTIWDWDVASDTIWLNANWKEMLGARPEETSCRIVELLPLIHPDDLERVRNAGIALLKATTAAS